MSSLPSGQDTSASSPKLNPVMNSVNESSVAPNQDFSSRPDNNLSLSTKPQESSNQSHHLHSESYSQPPFHLPNSPLASNNNNAVDELQNRMAAGLSLSPSPSSSNLMKQNPAQHSPPPINAPYPMPSRAFAQTSQPGSRAASPGLRMPQPPYAPTHPAGSSSLSNLSNLNPPNPSFSGSQAAAGNSIIRSSSTPNVLQAQHTGGSQNGAFLSPMLHPQKNGSSPRFGSKGGNRPYSTLSSSSSIDLTSGHATDFYSYSQRDARDTRAQSMAFTELPSASAFDLSQSFLSSNLGSNSSSLVPRMKTIEMYRKNAKKSNDPVIQFQFAQYMLQTALLASTSAPTGSQKTIDGAGVGSGLNANGNPNAEGDFELEFPTRPVPRINHSRAPSNASSLSLAQVAAGAKDAPQATLPSPSLGPLSVQDERKIKRDLLKEAVSNLRRLSDKGYADAQYLLGDAYSSGALGKADLRESFALFQLAGKHGHAEASYRTALCLEEGWGTSKDPRRAIQFLRQAASRNHPGAMLRLGVAQFYGKLGMHLGASTSNKVKIQQDGIRWLTRAADAANEIFPQGPYELAKIYEEGYRDLIFKDLQYAVQLYVKSADLGYVPAASKLGHAYEYGELGCPQDAALSIHYYTIAALGGDPKAMLAMCAWYMVGAEPMLPRNAEEAYEWALRAAERGLAKAQYATGYFLENGIGAERDILQASRWYHMAASGGDERAIERIKNNRVLAAKPQTKHKKKSTANLKSLLGSNGSSSNVGNAGAAPSIQGSMANDGASISGQSVVRPSGASAVAGGNGSVLNDAEGSNVSLVGPDGALAVPGNAASITGNESINGSTSNFANGSVNGDASVTGVPVKEGASNTKNKKKGSDKDCIVM